MKKTLRIFCAASMLLPAAALSQGLIGDTIQVRLYITNISPLRNDRPDPAVVTADASDQLVYGESSIFSINPNTNSIVLHTENTGFAVATGSFIELSNLDLPFEQIVGATISSSSGSISPVVSVTNDAVRLDFPSWNSSFSAGVSHTINLITTNTVGPDLASQIIENDVLTNAPITQFRAVFSESVQDFDAGDLELIFTGSLTTNGPIVVTGADAAYQLAVPVIGDGTIQLDIKSESDITPLTSAQPLVTRIASRPVSIDQTAPTIVSQTPSVAPLESGAPYSVEMVFSEEIIGGSGDSLTNVLTNVSNLSNSGLMGYSANNPTTSTYYISVELIDPALPGSMETGVRTTGHGIRDLAGNGLSAVPPLLLTTVIPNSFQQWVVDTGLTAELGRGYGDDGDLDGVDNFTEFMRNRDPLVADEPPRSLFHFVEFDGALHGVLTFAAPDDFTYVIYENLGGGKGDPYHYMEAYREISDEDVGEYITPSLDLTEYGNAEVLIEEVSLPSVPTNLPGLDAGWSYRHIRIQQSIDDLPRAFIHSDAYHPDE